MGKLPIIISPKWHRPITSFAACLLRLWFWTQMARAPSRVKQELKRACFACICHHPEFWMETASRIFGRTRTRAFSSMNKIMTQRMATSREPARADMLWEWCHARPLAITRNQINPTAAAKKTLDAIHLGRRTDGDRHPVMRTGQRDTFSSGSPFSLLIQQHVRAMSLLIGTWDVSLLPPAPENQLHHRSVFGGGISLVCQRTGASSAGFETPENMSGTVGYRPILSRNYPGKVMTSCDQTRNACLTS
ncbi:hypothetical protein QBC37DRAFT_393983 [Rhypophila decipiens]|uniref:Uncharacterized protein n=1 Tax=Rhypophila decipiens TaxID=261697 RepID=A0AAN6YJF8_9PEZI|nr:hypothetical protein QBC37DRAFT_393983 [Rhypophila decipiens]